MPRAAQRGARRGLFAGSFDPITVGHVDLIERARSVLGELVVGVGFNPAKRTLFDLDERLELLRASLPGQVPVVSFSGLVVDAAKAQHATVLVRGVRGPSDLDLEMRNALANRELSGIETILVPCDPRFAHVSSTLVREIAGYGGDVSKYVPGAVLRAILDRGVERR